MKILRLQLWLLVLICHSSLFAFQSTRLAGTVGQVARSRKTQPTTANIPRNSVGSDKALSSQNQPLVATVWAMQSRRLPIMVVSDGVSHGKAEVYSAFTEQSTGQPLPGDIIKLCTTKSGECKEPEANSTFPLYLNYSGPIYPGTYKGTIRITGLQQSSIDLPNITIYVSSNSHLAGGIVVVILTSFLAWWVKVYLSNRITRDQALLPIAADTERLHTFQAMLKRATVQFNIELPTLAGAVKNLLSELNPSRLEANHGLPQNTPSPFSPTGPISSDYTDFLAKTDSDISLLTIFIRDGIESVVERAEAGTIATPQAIAALKVIDASYSSSLTLDQASQQIQRLAVPTDSQAVTEAQEPMPSSEQTPWLPPRRLMIEIRWMNTAAWLVLLGVAALGTIVALVLKPGFGKPIDYLLCVTATFGMSIIGGVAIPNQRTATTLATPSTPVASSPGFSGS